MLPWNNPNRKTNIRGCHRAAIKLKDFLHMKLMMDLEARFSNKVETQQPSLNAAYLCELDFHYHE